MKKIIYILALGLGFLQATHAQQDPQYTQYMYNMSVVNPAYAGSKEGLSTGLLYRRQWINLENAPATGTLFGHAPVGKNVGIGLSVVSDKIGPVSENNVYGDFSYTLELGGEHKVALGLKTGLTFHNIDLFTQINSTLPNANDGVFGRDVSNTYFNLGTGVFYYTDKYYLAVSMPNMLKSKHLDFDGRKYGNETNHAFITGGYVFDLNENFKLKPFFMAKSAYRAPTSVDLSLNLLMYNKFEAGLTHRIQDSFGAMVNYQVAPNLRIGYAYDHITSSLNNVTPSSHEIILLYDVNFSKKVSRSPRYF
jgi:type IX secretion system PorP/SprF family membrane protein